MLLAGEGLLIARNVTLWRMATFVRSVECTDSTAKKVHTKATEKSQQQQQY